ncbi:hypothetical protein Y032_0242g3420 [Ancylostoma ceylanicum]|uniref:SCP domain-containing protein n=1 Tax=Ancylostoma ceylanicum TaxID=53326 RepID=A0A016SEK9_9BILA|nr:hypothetical protein Y032_0242g3420 [Ancylostoma ceylanicum]
MTLNLPISNQQCHADQHHSPEVMFKIELSVEEKTNSRTHENGLDSLISEWSCDLENKAIVMLNQKCKNEQVSSPRGTTAFYYQDNERDAIEVWLSEINDTSIDLHDDPEAYVTCRGKSELINYCNLVRYDASRIGCATKECDGKKSVFCLTNKEQLKTEDVLYYWGKGACPKGSCRPPTYGCNHHIGLCFKPLPTTTMTTTVPIWKLECTGKLCRYIRVF